VGGRRDRRDDASGFGVQRELRLYLCSAGQTTFHTMEDFMQGF
jgi:hypothetical protein